MIYCFHSQCKHYRGIPRFWYLFTWTPTTHSINPLNNSLSGIITGSQTVNTYNTRCYSWMKWTSTTPRTSQYLRTSIWTLSLTPGSVSYVIIQYQFAICGCKDQKIYSNFKWKSIFGIIKIEKLPFKSLINLNILTFFQSRWERMELVRRPCWRFCWGSWSQWRAGERPTGVCVSATSVSITSTSWTWVWRP